MPGLIAAGGSLDTDTLRRAYAHGVFPWFGPSDPILWWSPHPRMTLQVEAFQLHRSLRNTLRRFTTSAGHEIRMDHDVPAVLEACASRQRPGQQGTWIVPAMRQAYARWHQAGDVHSVETWVHGQRVGGLYLVNLGGYVFGESMFAVQKDASKIALAALVAFCREHHLTHIDCQQETAHLASLGARPIARDAFAHLLARHLDKPAPCWAFSPLYWKHLPGVMP
jgi:leucyl/phenylalanyl-tRNA---protein transferase